MLVDIHVEQHSYDDRGEVRPFSCGKYHAQIEPGFGKV